VTPKTYNPGFLADDELVARFVVRHHELDTIADVLRHNTGPSNQHVLAIGPRGFGKSTLVLRAAAAIRRDPALARRWWPVVFAEDSYEISSAGEFWLQALLHLGDALDDPKIRALHAELRRERDDRRLATRALGALLDVADARDQRLLLVVENLDQVFDQLPESDAWDLRRALQHDRRLMLLATAVQRFDGIDRPNQAMFDLFRRIELPPLDARECDRVWTSVTGARLGVRRAKAVRILCGGNPRLVAVLARSSRGRDLRTLHDVVEDLIDDQTGHFQSSIASLSGQSRRVFLAVAELWHPSTARAIAEAARLDVNATSANLQRLVKGGRVTIARSQGKNHYYQSSDPLYGIYWRLRRRGAAEPRVRSLLDVVGYLFGWQRRPRRSPFDRPAPAADAALAVDAIRQRLSDPVRVRDDLPAVLSDAMCLAAAGLTPEVADVLATAESAPLLEPLLVALRLRLGETVDAPIEVLEVAEEVRQRIDALAASGNIWRTDPLDLVLPDEIDEEEDATEAAPLAAEGALDRG
jgi:hypothetical protein